MEGRQLVEATVREWSVQNDVSLDVAWVDGGLDLVWTMGGVTTRRRYTFTPEELASLDAEQLEVDLERAFVDEVRRRAWPKGGQAEAAGAREQVGA